MQIIKVNLGKRSYPIMIGRGILKDAGSYISRLDIGQSGVIITNSKIKKLYGSILTKCLAREHINTYTLTVPDSETSKSYKAFSKLVGKIAMRDKGKKPFIIAFGGGVIGDLAGFAAAVYRRGVPFLQIPTTLVAQVDSSIGGKTAIDLPVAKNLLGAFYQPSIVISDTSLLKTLPEREIKCGLSEIIKYSIITSRSFFNFLSKNISSIRRLHKKNLERIIRKCSLIKSNVVSADEKDSEGVRSILNYGHTIGHAIEAASAYKGRYNHGEAIAVGMIAAAGISNRMRLLPKNELSEIKAIIKKSRLPVKARGLKAAKIMESLCHDKKFSHGVNRFILPVRIGKAKAVKNIPKKRILEAIKEICR